MREFFFVLMVVAMLGTLFVLAETFGPHGAGEAVQTDSATIAPDEPEIKNVSGGFDPLSITVLAEINGLRLVRELPLLSWSPAAYLAALDLAIQVAYGMSTDELDVCEAAWRDKETEGAAMRWWSSSDKGLACPEITAAGVVVLYYDGEYIFLFVGKEPDA